MHLTRHLVALLGVAALAAPAAASAHDDDHRGGRDKVEDGVHHGTHAEPGDDGRRRGRDKAEDDDRRGRGRDRKAVKLDTFEFKGVYGADGTVTVAGGNSRVRRAGFVGQVVTFDFTGARISVADVDGNGTADLADVQSGDRVNVQVKLPRSLKAADAGTLRARKLVDRTHPRVSDDDASRS